jgi:hypothetical protein
MKANWDEVQEESLIAEGEHLTRVVAVEQKTSSKGDEMWSLKHRVIEGASKDLTGYDNITFAPGAAMQRAKLVITRLGIHLENDTEVLPEHLVGRAAYTTWYHDEYNGRKIAKITFDGYRRAENVQRENPQVMDNLPF